jgi:hypothetical protein
MADAKFAALQVGDVVELPGRAKKPDRYAVLTRVGNRVRLQSLLDKSALRVMMDNQFDHARFVTVAAEAPAAIQELALPPVPLRSIDDYVLTPEDTAEIAALRRKYGG